jgi:ribosome-associated protein
MAKRKDKTTKLEEVIIEGILERKGKNIVSIDFRKHENAICNKFIICNGDSNTHVKSIADSIEVIVKKKLKETVWKKEGMENSLWVLLDYVDVVVHIFQTDIRDYYKLESLWADSISTNISV